MRRLTSARDREWQLLSHGTPRIAHATQGRLIGRVQLAEAALPLPARVRMGWFITEAGRAATDPRLAEGRVEMVATETPSEFAFTLDAAALAQQHGHPFCTLWIDLVREGEHWFYQAEGGGALRIDIALPAPLLGDVFGMAMLQTLLAQTGQHALFHAIRQAEERHAIGRMLREELLDPQALLPASRPPRPSPRDEHAPEMPTDPASEALRLPMQLDATLRAGTPWPVFGAAEAGYFQRGRVVHQRTGLPLSQAMLDAMGLVEPALLPAALDNPDALRRWWLFDIILAHGLPIEALPPDHRRHWLAPFVADDIAPANRFMVEAWERASGAARGYDPLQNAAERLAFQLGQIIRIWRDHRLAALLGREAQAFWAQPIALSGGQVTLFTLLACMVQPIHAPTQSQSQAAVLLGHCQALAARLAAACPGLGPLLKPLPRESSAASGEPAYLLGFRREFGAAQALRGAAASLARQGIATRLFDAESRRPLAYSDGRLRFWGEGATNPPGQGLEAPASLFFGKPAQMAGLIRDPALVGITARRRIGIFGWAFADLPAAAIAGAREMDVIGAASAFTRDVFQRATGRKVVLIPPALELPVAPADPYSALIEARSQRFIFHSPVHAGAGLRQVNPSAVVSAFAQAFPGGQEPAVLVLHAPTGIGADASDPLGEWALIQAAAADPRIILVEEFAERDRRLGFVAHADCVVSAHRSTGFGTSCAEALGYGVPLIATGYSGNLDYCDAQNSHLLEYRLRDIQPGEYPHGMASQWADVSLDHLAQQMQAVMADPGRARAMAALGQARVRATYSEAALDAALARVLAG